MVMRTVINTKIDGKGNYIPKKNWFLLFFKLRDQWWDCSTRGVNKDILGGRRGDFNVVSSKARRLFYVQLAIKLFRGGDKSFKIKIIKN